MVAPQHGTSDDNKHPIDAAVNSRVRTLGYDCPIEVVELKDLILSGQLSSEPEEEEADASECRRIGWAKDEPAPKLRPPII